jgi:glycosyltransferase involved in cell wall biosynthesis
MRIGLVFYDMQEFGGLEEYATALAVALKAKSQSVAVFSCAWIPPDNQYFQRLKEKEIPVIQPPKWLSLPASDWDTKEKIISRTVKTLSPLIFLLALAVKLVKGRSMPDAKRSARGWLQGRLSRIVSPDRRKSFTQFMLALWCWRWQPNVLHLQGYTTNLLYVIEWANRKRIPVVYEEHQTPDPMFDWWKGFQGSINKATVVVAVSEKSAQALKEVCSVTRPIRVRSPLMVDPIASGSKAPAVMPETHPFRVTTVARLYETKGLNYLLETVVEVRRRYPEIEFHVYGDGPLLDSLLKYAAELGLDGSSIFLGAFSHKDLPGIMEKTDLFLLSSVLEGQPLALVEAMAYSCPIVATSVGGIPELIQDGVNGFLCPPGNPECLAEKVMELVENPRLRKQMGAEARKKYEQGPYQPAAVSGELMEIYQEALEGK